MNMSQRIFNQSHCGLRRCYNTVTGEPGSQVWSRSGSLFFYYSCQGTYGDAWFTDVYIASLSGSRDDTNSKLKEDSAW